MTPRSALITGITGQDGSYLAELLLERGYDVHGMVRRSSTEAFQRIEHLRERLTLHSGDLLDQRSLSDVLRACEPAEIYNLAAMSFVAASWSQPVLTAEFTGVGVTRLLEAMREVCRDARFYQASSSEMFGKVRQVPQNESTPFYPRSPYGVAKAYGHFITVNYRESYDLFACSGILFNHECLLSSTPIMVRRAGVVEVTTPIDLVAMRRKGPSVQQFEPEGVEIWDGEDWTPIAAITATRRRPDDPDHRLLCVQARAGVVETTAHHHLLDENGEQVRCDSIETGDSLLLADKMPPIPPWTIVPRELGEFLGLMTADGSIGPHEARFTNNDSSLQHRVAELWSRLFMGRSRGWLGASGFNPDSSVGQLSLTRAPRLLGWLREQLYTADGHKKVPPIVLNADVEAQTAYLDGYYAGDGLKRGNGDSVKTNSAVLAQGLCWLYELDERPCSVYVEHRGGRTYYQLNVGSRAIVLTGSRGGQHLRKPPGEVRRIDAAEPADPEWVFDLETESGRFCAGVGRLVVHNSPRRGKEFVTRKVSDGVARIEHGLADELVLGNLDAERDWGHAKDYVEAMWLMLQQDEPDDYVIASGKKHSVRELVDLAFAHVGRDPAAHVRTDPSLMRPAEVEHLVGDFSKAREQLGWEPRTSFEELVRLMVDSDLELLRGTTPGPG